LLFVSILMATYTALHFYKGVKKGLYSQQILDLMVKNAKKMAMTAESEELLVSVNCVGLLGFFFAHFTT